MGLVTSMLHNQLRNFGTMKPKLLPRLAMQKETTPTFQRVLKEINQTNFTLGVWERITCQDLEMMIISISLIKFIQRCLKSFQ